MLIGELVQAKRRCHQAEVRQSIPVTEDPRPDHQVAPGPDQVVEDRGGTLVADLRGRLRILRNGSGVGVETTALRESRVPGAQTGSRFAFFLHLLRLWPCFFFFLHFLSAAARSPVGALV